MVTLKFQNTGTEFLRVNVDDILYVEADGNYCKMFLRGGKTQDLWFNKKHFVDIVEECMQNEKSVFATVGRSLVINMKYIYRIDPVKNDITLFGGGCTDMISLHASQIALATLKEYISDNEIKSYRQ